MNDEYPILSQSSDIHARVACELVTVPEWKARVWVYELTGRELDEYRSPMFKTKDGGLEMSMQNSTLRLLALALRDGGGGRLYPNTKRGILELGDLPAGGSERLVAVARRLSGLAGTDTADEDAEDDTSDENEAENGEAGEAGNSASSAGSPGGGPRTSSSSFDSLVISGAPSGSS
jgi:hypothetical protein